MSNIVYGDEKIRHWVWQNLFGDYDNFDFDARYEEIGIECGGELIAGCVYHNFTGHSCEVTFYSSTPKWCSRLALKYLFGYPFNQLGYNRITAITSEKNHRAIAVMQKLGFEHEGTLREYFGANDGLLFGMLKTDCRWLKNG